MTDVDDIADVNADAERHRPLQADGLRSGPGSDARRNEDYWGDAPEIDGVVVTKYTDTTSAQSALSGGQLDMMWSVPYDQIEPQEASGLHRDRSRRPDAGRGLRDRQLERALQRRPRTPGAVVRNGPRSDPGGGIRRHRCAEHRLDAHQPEQPVRDDRRHRLQLRPRHRARPVRPGRRQRGRPAHLLGDRGRVPRVRAGLPDPAGEPRRDRNRPRHRDERGQHVGRPLLPGRQAVPGHDRPRPSSRARRRRSRSS